MKNKIKKIIPCLFVLLAVVGFFSYEKNVEAQSPKGDGTCFQPADSFGPRRATDLTREACGLNPGYEWVPTGETTPLPALTRYDQCLSSGGTPDSCKQYSGSPTNPSSVSEFQKSIDGACQPGFLSSQWSFNGCLLKFLYYTIFVIPSLLLTIAAYFFNVLISLVIQSSMYDQGFINKAWVVVRDLSNIFFILILLYVAIKTVLNMGGHETKSMITSVIIMAVLINFSLFFTKIVIDSSNILALIFYNKLEVTYEKDGKPTTRPYDGVTGEKDIAGSMYKAFNATNLLRGDFIKKLSTQQITQPGPGGTVQTSEVVPGLQFGPTLGIILLSGGIMIVAAYALFTSGIFFIGRIIELWLLMIFSPFAFMSFAVPKLAHTEYGWDKWAEKLLSTAFMAPIFMFFMYLIFMLLGAGIFEAFLKPGPDAIGGGKIASILSSAMGEILSILLPALIIMGLLLKAKDLAKKGGGQFGEMAMNTVKAGAVLALGGAALGTAAVARGTIGAAAKYVANPAARTKDMDIGGRLASNFSTKLSFVNPAAYARGANILRKGAAANVAESFSRTQLGIKMKTSDEKLSEKTHAKHVLDAKAQKVTGDKEANYAKLTESEQEKVQKSIDKDELAKSLGYASGFDNISDMGIKNMVERIVEEIYSGPVVLANGQEIQKGDTKSYTASPDKKAEMEAEMNRKYTEEITRANGLGTPEERKAAIDIAAQNRQKSLDRIEGIKIKEGATALVHHSEEVDVALGQLAQGLRKGSYDIRNAMDASLIKNKGILNKTAIALGMGLALAYKSPAMAIGANIGTSKRDVFEDLKGTLVGALSNIKISPGDLGGGGKKGGDHGGGHGGDHGGGHH